MRARPPCLASVAVTQGYARAGREVECGSVGTRCWNRGPRSSEETHVVLPNEHRHAGQRGGSRPSPGRNNERCRLGWTAQIKGKEENSTTHVKNTIGIYK